MKEKQSGFGFKRSLGVVLALLLLAGCGQSGSNQQIQTPAPAQQYDAAVQKAYDEIVAKEMPGVSIDLVDAAKKEGKVVYYHLANPGVKPMVEAFKKAFPFIQVEEFEATGGAVFERFQTEARAGRVLADVFLSSTLAGMDKWAKEGLVMDYKIANDAEYPDSVKKSGFRYPTSYSTIGVAWNPAKVTDEEIKVMETWEGLLSPKLANKTIGIMDVSAGGVSQSANYVIWKTYGEKVWAELSKRKVKLYNGTPPMLAALVPGEIDLAAWSSDTGLYAEYQKGAPVRWLYPKPVAVAPYGQLIAAKAPHPSAGKLLQEFSFTKSAQTAWAAVSTPSFRKDVGDLRAVAKEPWFKAPTEFFNVDNEQFDTELKQLMDLWNGHFKK